MGSQNGFDNHSHTHTHKRTWKSDDRNTVGRWRGATVDTHNDADLSPLPWLMPNGCGSKPFGDPIWLVGEFTTHFRTNFSGWIESEVHWWYDLDFDKGQTAVAQKPEFQN